MMSNQRATQQLDLAIRHYVYKYFVDEARPPSAAVVANVFDLSEDATIGAYQRLHQRHFFFLAPGTTDILMANPLSARPTKFKVSVGKKSYWANCAWDMLGIPAMVRQDAAIRATFEDTQEKVEIVVHHGQVKHDGGFVHFPLPVGRWYDDLIFT